MSAGRIETYLHSDSTTPNKGGCMVEVCCSTDFAAKTDIFVEFCKFVVRRCFAFGIKDPAAFVETNELLLPVLQQKKELEEAIREPVTIRRIAMWNLSDRPETIG